MHGPEISRRSLLLAALAAPTLSALQGCAAPLPVNLNAASTPAAQALLRECAMVHGLSAFQSLRDISVSYQGEWRALIGKLQPALVDESFRGSSEERLLLREGIVAQAHKGPGGRKQVVRRTTESAPGQVRVWFNGEEARDAERRAAASLVADAYRLFLLGPLLLIDRPLVMDLGDIEWVNEHACDVLQLQLVPGLGHARVDQAALFIDRKERLLRRVRFTLDGLESTRGAIAEVEMFDHLSLHGVLWPTRFYERLVRPLRMPVHDWHVTGLDVNRGLRPGDVEGSEFSGAATAAAPPLARRAATA
jgi:hypothetical protein